MTPNAAPSPVLISPGPTISAGYVNGVLAFAEKKGASRAALIERAGIDPALFEDHDNRIPYDKYKTLMRAAQRACNDPALALHFGEAVDMSEVSIVGLIANASLTMGQAFQQIQRYNRLVMEAEAEDGGYRFVLEQQGGHLWMVDRRADPNAFPESSEGAFASLVCGPRRFLEKPHVHEVHFTHEAPSYKDEYERIFQCPVVFSSRWNAMRLHPDIAEWRVALQPRYVFGILTDHADALLKELQDIKTVRARVESLLTPILHTGDYSAEWAALEMGFSRQTLFRKLKAEGVTYEEVLDALRKKMAIHYLNGDKVSVKETAYLVGFADPAAFSRAFKRWTGDNPQAFRRNERVN